ncbi:GNAT family N-acetyltransferase [Pelagibius litoralis]|uniref:GNAT family N-acetyltransferase n=1 Tax=Pelagibius litoralis TaxID=374515 RepID=A0A967C4M9_9PROT|nr:GNAT family N-acetyltransferase [Pelagibius litoralis]NIA68589.1 GNAT family N-acetyltransferase [Pelagibius litoralis]
MFAGNPELTLRRAVPDDAWAVQNLIHAAFARHAPALGRKPRAMLADYALAVRAHQVWVLAEAPPKQREEQQNADSLIAVLELIAEEAHLAIQALAVRPDRQRRGLGTALMQLAEQEARRQGVPLLKLNSPEIMTESLSLCAALGFHETHRQPAWDSQIVFMEKVLA